MNDKKTRIITLTDSAPVNIVEDEWPTIASAEWEDANSQYSFQASRTWDASIRVRRHEDGRTLVYGRYCDDSQHPGEADALYRQGALHDADADVIQAIRAIGGQLVNRLAGTEHEDATHNVQDLIAECIGDMPAVTL